MLWRGSSLLDGAQGGTSPQSSSMPCACTQVSFTCVPRWRGLTGEGAESRLPQFSSLFYLLISFCWSSVLACSVLCFDLVFIIYLDWFVFWIIFVLLRFSGASFNSSNTNFESGIFGAWDYIYVTQAITIYRG